MVAPSPLSFRLSTLVAPVLGASCHVLSAAPDGAAPGPTAPAPSADARRERPCLVVDVGGGVAPELRRHLAAEALAPVAVLATHGHVDHTWDGVALADELGVPFVCHAADAHRLADPWGTLDPWGARGPLAQAVAAQAASFAGAGLAEPVVPARLTTFDGPRTVLVGPDGLLGADLLGPGVVVEAVHAPGHTEGSTLYVVTGVPDDGSTFPEPGRPAGAPGARATVLSGDVLFAGSVGRTDLPGGDPAVMARTLRDVVATLPPDAIVLPGHGPATTVGAELVTNPYLGRR